MNRILLRDHMIVGLLLLAVAQITLFVVHSAERGPSSRWLRIGDDPSSLVLVDSAGESVSLAMGGPTILLVFDSECAHSATVAPTWAAWIKEAGGDFRTLAVSAEPFETARAFAAEHGWAVEVRSVGAGRPESRLASRTPWLFVLDEAGVILAEGHGADVAALTAVLRDELLEEPGS